MVASENHKNSGPQKMNVEKYIFDDSEKNIEIEIKLCF